ncbi:MAG: 4Fe-4S binding protein [Oscillospiraceae bacterium]|nr:4Fe-4S binding protein [Oscillospiraceae bacterium]
MRQIITVDENKCVGCNACIRACPVHANKTFLKEGTKDKYVTNVDYSSCINCGECVKACTHGARGYVDDIDEFKKLLEAKKPIVLIVAPAIRVSFPKSKWRVLMNWLRSRGRVKIYDVAYGADICTYMHNQYMMEHPGAKLVSQPCPAVVNYIQMYRPELISHLSPVLSPAGCVAAYLRRYKNVSDPMFMLSPCIAKTSEAEREKLFDYNVTFRHLEDYANSNGIRWDGSQEFEFDESYEGSLGRLYPMPGGLKETMHALNKDLTIRTAEGPHTLYDRLERYYQTEDRKKPDLLDVLNCQFGCNLGTATASTVATLMEAESTMDSLANQAKNDTKGGLLGVGKLKRFKEFDKTLRLSDFTTNYHENRVTFTAPTVEDYKRIFRMMHKDTDESQNINCGACGYRTCHDMACAIFRGMNVRENCIHYLKYSLDRSFVKIKDVYDTTVDEVSKINAISEEMNDGQGTIVSAANDIGTKASELSGNISRLQKFSQNVLNMYKDKKSEELKPEDFSKMQQFVAAISTMTQSYYEVAQEFEQRSENITEQVMNLAAAIDALSELSENLKETVTEAEETAEQSSYYIE